MISSFSFKSVKMSSFKSTP